MLKTHLTISSLHGLDEADADVVIGTAEIESYIDKGETNIALPVIGSFGRKGAGKQGKAGRGRARAERPRSRSRSHSPHRRIAILRHGRAVAKGVEVDDLQRNIDQLANQIAVVAGDMNNQASALNAPARATPQWVSAPASSSAAPLRASAAVIARERPNTISVPRGTAHLLNEALLRAVQSSQQMRQAMDNYERAARSNEALIERAQQNLSHLLED